MVQVEWIACAASLEFGKASVPFRVIIDNLFVINILRIRFDLSVNFIINTLDGVTTSVKECKAASC